MDKNFSQNQLKPGDKGFVYDKRVDFGKKNDAPLENDSWGEEEDEEKNGEDDEDMDYFDDDFS